MYAVGEELEGIGLERFGLIDTGSIDTWMLYAVGRGWTVFIFSRERARRVLGGEGLAWFWLLVSSCSSGR